MTSTARSTPRKRKPRCLAIERLEDRWCFAVGPMSVVEQHLHELVNWVRAHPDEAAARFGVGLNDGLAAGTITSDAKPPLARNELLRAAVAGHVRDMVQNSFFSHTGSDGSTFSQRIQSAGYGPYRAVAENLVWWGVAGAALPDQSQVLVSLVREWFQSPAHRKYLFNPEYREVGTAVVVGPFTWNGTTYNADVSGQNYGKREVDPFLTGVGCLGKRADFAMCDVTKPIVGATVTATRAADQSQRRTTTGSTGDYDLQLPDGVWSVRIEGGGLPEPVDVPAVVMAGRNVKLDFVPVVSTRWRNSSNAFDVNNDQRVTPLDALVLVNELNVGGTRSLPAITAPPALFLDANGDNVLSPADVLFVINRLNVVGGGEGEGTAGARQDDARRGLSDSGSLSPASGRAGSPAACAALDSVLVASPQAPAVWWLLDEDWWLVDGDVVS